MPSKILEDRLNVRAFATYIDTKSAHSENFLGEAFFPNKKFTSTEASYLKKEYSLPQVIRLGQIDVQPTIRDRGGFDEVIVEFSTFRESFLLTEKQKINLVRLSNNPEDPAFNDLLDDIFNDAHKLVLGARATLERNRFDVLCTGKLNFGNTGQKVSLDYGLKAHQTPSTTLPWSNADANILAEIEDWQSTMRIQTGTKPTVAIMDYNVFKQIRNHPKIIKLWNSVNSDYFVSENKVRQLLKDELGIEVHINEQMFKDVDLEDKAYMHENKFVLLPNTQMGVTALGLTPEEVNEKFAGSSSGVQFATIDEGLSLSYRQSHESERTEVRLSFTTIPLVPNIDKLLTATIT